MNNLFATFPEWYIGDGIYPPFFTTNIKEVNEITDEEPEIVIYLLDMKFTDEETNGTYITQ